MANTIADKLTYLSGTKDAIKQAIIGKGIEITDTDTFRSYADKIETIQAGGSIAGAPSGIRFAYSTFTTVPTEIIPYLEAQTDLSSMFSGCSSLKTVQLFSTKKANNMISMFYNCKALETVPLFETSNVTSMGSMFSGCSKIITVPQLDTSKCTDMDNMFYYCYSLETVPQLDTSKCTNMYMMFRSCQNLTTVPLLNFSNVTNTNMTFFECLSLTNLGGFTGLKMNLDLHYSPLTVDSVMNVINNAADMTSSPRTLTLRRDAFDKLTQEQITTANAKGWNIAVE